MVNFTVSVQRFYQPLVVTRLTFDHFFTFLYTSLISIPVIYVFICLEPQKLSYEIIASEIFILLTVIML